MMWQQTQKIKSPGKLNVLVVLILVIGVVLMILNIYQLQQMRQERSFHEQPITVNEPTAGKTASRAPVVWIHGKRVGYVCVFLVIFMVLGYRFELEVSWA